MRKRTIAAASAALAAGEIKAEALVEEALANAARSRALNAIAAIDPERALATARARDREIAAGERRGPLHGVPLTVKDLFDVPGFPTAAGTRAPLPPLGRSTAVARLEAAGAIVLAKTNMHEIALGLTGENPWTGDVKNPVDPERQAGGSSSGSAVAVATGVGLASLGTDTGGSIRAPAALCGITGFKPTHGLVPLDGALPLSPTCDHAGPLALDVEDARIVTEVLAARALRPAITEPPRLAVPRRYLEGRLSPGMRAAFERLLQRLQGAGAALVEVETPGLELTLAAYTPLVRAEAAYTHRQALSQSPEGFSEPVRRSLEDGARMLAGAYLKARATRRQVCDVLRDAFRDSRADALILPATPAAALRRGEVTVELEAGPASHREAQLALTAPFSLAGAPAVAVPFAREDSLPLGVQLVSPWGDDAALLGRAAWLETLLRQDRG